MVIKLEITQEHINKALALMSDSKEPIECRCPMALVVRDLYPDSLVEVVGNGIFVNNEITFTHSQNSKQFLREFDSKPNFCQPTVVALHTAFTKGDRLE